jgi:hypothetical protein
MHSLIRPAVTVAAVTLAFSASVMHAASINLYSSGDALRSYDEGGFLKPGLYANGDLHGYPAAEPTRAIAEFSLAALPASAVVTAATFSYYPGGVAGWPNDRLGFYGYSGNGVAEAADYGAGTLIHQNAGAVSPGVYNSVDVTAFVQSIVAGDATHAGFVVRNNTTNSSVINIYTYYDATRPESWYNAPRLSIQYDLAAAPAVPTPAAAAGGMVLVGGLLAKRRRNAIT